MRDPILLDFPSSFETERLLVRAALPGDGPAINQAIRESINELRPWMPWAQKMPTPEESEAFARRSHVDFITRASFIMFFFAKHTETLLGGSGLRPQNWAVPSFEIGYWIRTSQSGKGLVTEAVRGLTGFAFEHLRARRLEIRCDPRNGRSASVAIRAGYRNEGTLRQQGLSPDGEIRDTTVYAMLSEDWQS